MTENNVLREGLAQYDICFTVYHKEKELKIFISIEALKQIESFHSNFDLKKSEIS